jgi:hypothetical protein
MTPPPIITLRQPLTLDAAAPAFRLYPAPGDKGDPPQWREIHTPDANARAAEDLAAAEAAYATLDPDDAAARRQAQHTINRLRAAAAYRPDPYELAPSALRVTPHLWHAVALREPEAAPMWLAPALEEDTRPHRDALLRGVAVRVEASAPARWPSALLTSPYPQALPDGAALVTYATAHDAAATAQGLRDALRRVALPRVAEMVRGDDLRAEMTAALAHIPDDAAVMPSEIHTRASLRAEVSRILSMMEDL